MCSKWEREVISDSSPTPALLHQRFHDLAVVLGALVKSSVPSFRGALSEALRLRMEIRKWTCDKTKESASHRPGLLRNNPLASSIFDAKSLGEVNSFRLNKHRLNVTVTQKLQSARQSAPVSSRRTQPKPRPPPVSRPKKRPYADTYSKDPPEAKHPKEPFRDRAKDASPSERARRRDDRPYKHSNIRGRQRRRGDSRAAPRI